MSFGDDDAPSAGLAPLSFSESGRHAGLSDSVKVGWTLRDSKDKLAGGYAFNINPQGITRVESSRATTQATKGSIYVDDFGPGAPQITLRQLVARGHSLVLDTGQVVQVNTTREDVIRFIDTIWTPAVQDASLQVHFHDNHLERGHEEHVYFPPNGLSIQRSVDLQNVWLLEVQMIGLDVRALDDLDTPDQPSNVTSKNRYIVRPGDTLTKIVVKLAGKKSSSTKRRAVLAKVLALNPQLRHARKLVPGAPNYAGTATVNAKPMRVYVGEVLLLPGKSALSPSNLLRGSGPGLPFGI